MSYKTLVTVVRDPALDRGHLEAALAFAEAQDAHLHILGLGIEHIPPEAFYGGTTPIAVQGTIAEAIEEAKIAEAAASELLKRSGVTGDVQRVVAQMGAVSQIVARYAQLADMVILSKPYGEGRSGEDVAVLEAALFSTRTPVVVLPKGKSLSPAPKCVVAAWNQSSEALAAIRAALPLMRDADSVEILVIDPPRHSADVADPGAPLAEMLSRHGVEVTVSVVAQTTTKVSDTISRHAAEQGADLVVMGAYGHSRLREAVLGGATRNMLENATLPMFIAH